MGVGAGQDPLGREASPSSWPIAPLGNSGALRKVCFQMTQAGSLPAGPLGGETAFSGEGTVFLTIGWDLWLVGSSPITPGWSPSDHPEQAPLCLSPSHS